MVFNEKKENEFLESYDASQYKHPSLTIDLVILTINPNNELCVILNKRDQYPYKDRFALPGGFINLEKDLDDSVKEILTRKTQLNPDYIHFEQLYTFGKVDRDPRTRVISVAYFALIPYSQLSVVVKNADKFNEAYKTVYDKKGDVVTSNQIFTLKQIKDLQLQNLMAFDHYEIIKTTIDRIKGKITYVPLAFHLVNNPYSFTIFEVQKVYEAFLDKKIDISNFRRDFKTYFLSKNIVELNGKTSTEFSKKPSACYKINFNVSENFVYKN